MHVDTTRLGKKILPQNETQLQPQYLQFIFEKKYYKRQIR